MTTTSLTIGTPDEMDGITRAIADLTDRLELARTTHRIAREKAEMTRLAEKLKAAAGVAGRLTTKIEARADSLIAREGALEQRTEQVFSPHEGILADAEKGLDAVERQLALLSNDPLESSGDSPQGQQTPIRPGMVSADPPVLPGDARKFDRMG